jgi:uncharacterized protein YegP (UPF0339 family)
VTRGRDGQWYVGVRGGNGEKILQSEGYTRRDSAMRFAKRLQRTWAGPLPIEVQP